MYKLVFKADTVKTIYKRYVGTRVKYDVDRQELYVEDKDFMCVIKDGYELLSAFTSKAPSVLYGIGFKAQVRENDVTIISAWYEMDGAKLITVGDSSATIEKNDIMLRFLLRRGKFDKLNGIRYD